MAQFQRYMIRYRILCLLVLVGTIVGSQSNLKAQEALVTDPEGVLDVTSSLYPAARTRGQAISSTARTTTAPFPFFDDFSSSTQALDSNLWLSTPVDEYIPTISDLRSYNAPSRGVLTFDGATYDRKKYSPFLEINYADFIESQPIDLSGFSPSDSLILSFFYQPGGVGDAPEEADSFLLAFDTTGAGDYWPVWATVGDGSAHSSFTYVQVVLEDSVFFHSDFKFRFENLSFVFR